MREHLPRLLSKNPCLISRVIFMSYRVLIGDCYDTLDQLDDESVDTCVTSPPYFSLRDYGEDKQIGLEATPEEYVELINNALTLRYGVGLLHVGDREGKSWEDEFVSKNDATAAELLCCGKRPTNTVERKFR